MIKVLSNGLETNLSERLLAPENIYDSIDEDIEEKNDKIKRNGVSPLLSFLKDLTTCEFDNSISKLQTSLDMKETMSRIKQHIWNRWDLQYILVFALLAFDYYIIEFPGLLFKTMVGTLLILALLIPATSQFFFPALPILTWLITFYSCSSFPIYWRPPIQVQFLPIIESILYGDDLSNILSTYQHPFLDILAWIPYGIIHFAIPFVAAALIFIFGPPTALRAYAFAFGYMNLTGVLTQILLPCAPPWYKYSYGLQPANYSVRGSPGGLARVDEILGVNMYSGSFGASPVVFGALPSLHSGCAVMVALYLHYVFPKAYMVWCGYVMWIWWSTMYLTHHYFVDLICGGVLSFVFFHVTKRNMLPKIYIANLSRWKYSVLEYEHENLRLGNENSRAGRNIGLNSGHMLEDLRLVENGHDNSLSPLILPVSSSFPSPTSPTTPVSPILLHSSNDSKAFVSGHMKPFNRGNYYRKLLPKSAGLEETRVNNFPRVAS
ncbi:hypothetical protein DASC09_024450 [Saccharomycopsis crataegensis]|uniref:Phosphatidic acid phosphatase type 2/haloperoxidase domain-containing protein n=1 Tax=Saccharomycopsis crataegensis TaxID=43959 RepID=A0AAV5QL94_9ASCO|nr:hypothetical protein DASC09_024450 [Saccharomycopsis crataegensis]